MIIVLAKIRWVVVASVGMVVEVVGDRGGGGGGWWHGGKYVDFRKMFSIHQLEHSRFENLFLPKKPKSTLFSLTT